MKEPSTGIISKVILVSGLFFVVVLHRIVSVEAAAIICGSRLATGQEQEGAVTAAGTEGAIKMEPNEKSLVNRDSAEASAALTSSVSSSTSASTTTTTTTTTKTTTASSDVKQFFQAVQCTIEKAKPWVEEIEKEAKRLEESAKRFGEGVISKLGDFMEKLIPNIEGPSHSSSSSNSNSNNSNDNNYNNKDSTNNKESSNNKHHFNSNPVKSLLSSILDGFGAVVSVVSGGVSSAAGNKTRAVTVEPEVERQTAVETTTRAAAAADAVPDAASVDVVAATIEQADELENQIADAADADVASGKRICPVGFAVDVRGLCQQQRPVH